MEPGHGFPRPRLRARSAPERLPHLAKGLGDATLSTLMNLAVMKKGGVPKMKVPQKFIPNC